MSDPHTSYPSAKNPFDEWPLRSGSRTTREKMGYRSYVEWSEGSSPEDWRKKWETYIRDMLYVAEQAIKFGHIEVHEGDPTTFTVHTSPTSTRDE